MSRCFHTAGPCNPQEHYMVNLDERLAEIKKLVDGKSYFSINRGRQYGKTTTLFALKKYLQAEYIVASLDFQFLTQEAFRDEYAFSAAFARRFVLSLRHVPEVAGTAIDGIKSCMDSKECGMGTLFEHLSDFCESVAKPVVLLIDEVDSASNNQVFLDFLALLRGYYIHRADFPTFHSVILAGVHDVRKLKQKIRPEEKHKYNSPWNIAVDFHIHMSLSPAGIAGMLAEYEADRRTGMDVCAMAGLLYEYTSGYPYLVSRLCQLMDEMLPGSPDFPDRAAAWTKDGFLASVKVLLAEKNTLFDSLVNKLTDYPELRELLYSVLLLGEKITYDSYNDIIDVAATFGFVKNVAGTISVANRIFETVLYNLFLSQEETSRKAI